LLAITVAFTFYEIKSQPIQQQHLEFIAFEWTEKRVNLYFRFEWRAFVLNTDAYPVIFGSGCEYRCGCGSGLLWFRLRIQLRMWGGSGHFLQAADPDKDADPEVSFRLRTLIELYVKFVSRENVTPKSVNMTNRES
jgi:hypothetical protein